MTTTFTTSTLSTTTVTDTTSITADTTTSTTTETIFPTPNVACDNQGLQYAFNAHTFTNDYRPPQSTDFPAMNVDFFKTAPPENGTPGVTNVIGFSNGDPSNQISIYGQPPMRTDFFAINHRGYLFARQSGEYTFYTPATDEITLFWIGGKAYSGFERDNADIDQQYIGSGGIPITFKVTLSVGQYYPIRILYANAQGYSALSFTVVAPDGTTIVSSNSDPSPYLVQFSCDGTAPPFPPFGQET